MAHFYMYNILYFPLYHLSLHWSTYSLLRKKCWLMFFWSVSKNTFLVERLAARDNVQALAPLFTLEWTEVTF